MTESNLAFETNESLVKELLSRSTFAGIIVRPRGPLEEVETEPVIQFDMMWSPRLPDSTIKKLLTEALEKLDV